MGGYKRLLQHRIDMQLPVVIIGVFRLPAGFLYAIDRFTAALGDEIRISGYDLIEIGNVITEAVFQEFI